jgi:diguanylate cyclase (GGDEF)-like protein
MTVREGHRRFSLAAKISALAIMLILVTAIGISSFTIRTEIKNYYAELLNHGITIADATARNTEYGVFTEDRRFLELVLSGLSTDDDIAYAAVLSADGRVLAQGLFRTSSELPARDIADIAAITQLEHIDLVDPQDGQRYLDVLYPVSPTNEAIHDPLLQTAPSGPAQTIGFVRLGLTKERLRAKIHELTVSTLLFTGLLVVAGSALSIYLSRRITSPLADLKSATTSIAKGNFEEPIAIKTTDEIADLASAFDYMRHGLRSYREQLVHDAVHDALTGLPNRTLFVDRLKHTITIAKRRTGYYYGVIVIDLDGFKIINDSLGHTVGDQLLIECSKLLLGCIRPGDTVARLGGDEFAVLLEDIGGEGNALFVASRIKKMLQEPVTVGGGEVFVTASMGIALSSGGYETPEQVLRDADTAMYQAKARDRSGYKVFEPAMHTHAVERLHLETALRRAIERNEIVTYYQPILSVCSKNIVGYEALARWQHAERGIVPPGQFIPLAEETGLIVAIERQVLRQACEQMCRWLEQYPQSELNFVSVNLAHKQIAQPDLVDHVAQVLTETGLRPQHLKLEITENVLFEDPEKATALLHGLRELGVQLYIDDFGTGYSSLSYLHRLPINGLKIDRSFVNRIDAADENNAVIRTIMMLARDMKFDVVAEGVETPSQLAHIEALACTYWQGFLFSRPVCGADAKALLAA